MKTTVPKLAKKNGIASKKILTWIGNGELRAVNLATTPGGRPRWAIEESDWEAFERKRQAVPVVKPIRRKRATATKDYFSHIPG